MADGQQFCSVDDCIITGELSRRPSRPPDYEAENRALAELADTLARHPDDVLQRLTDLMLELDLGDSAGISLAEGEGADRVFRWVALSGEWGQFKGGTMPFSASPCGVVVTRHEVMLFQHPELAFPDAHLDPLIKEVLLVPFAIDGDAIGTVWAIAHSDHRLFNDEDARLLKSLSRFASAAHQMVAALGESEQRISANEAALEYQLAAARELQRLSTRLIPEQSPESLYDQILDTAMELMRADAASMQLLDDDGKRLRRAATRNLHPDSTEYWTWVDASHASTCGQALSKNERVVVEDVEASPDLIGTGDLEAFRASGTRAVQSTPLLTRTGRPIGMISTHWRAPRQFKESDFGLFDVLARQVADLLERSKTEVALRETERRRDAALLAAEMGTWNYDLVADVCHFDARAQEMYNLPSEQLDHRPEGVSSVVHPDDVGPMFDEIQRATDANGDGRYDIVYRIAHAGGTYRWLRAVGIAEFEGRGPARRAIRIIGASRDITFEREAEVALRESQERQAFLLKLSDALRPLQDARDIQTTAMRHLAEQLGVARAGYYEVAADQDSYSLKARWERDILPLPEKLKMSDFGPDVREAYLVGRTLVSRDIERDSPSAAGREMYRKIGARARIGVPLVKEGSLLTVVAVHSRPARDWTSAEIQLVEDVAERTWEAVERARAETALRVAKGQQSFLLDLSDALRPLGDPVEIQRIATRVLGEQLGASRVFYVTIERDGDTGVIQENYVNGVPSRVGIYSLSSFAPWTVKEWRAGKLACSSDVETDARYGAAERAAYASVSTRAGFGVPLVKEGRLAAVLGVNQSTPRAWTDQELKLASEVAERTWAAVERARAEEALRESERHATLLLAELQHRVRNSLAVLRSIARRTAENSDTVEDMLAHFQGRLDAFSRVQAAVTRSPDGTVDLTSLVEDELVAHAARGGEQFKIDGPPVALDPKAAERISLAIHELTTNAVKHGALVNGGSVHVFWRKEGRDGNQRLVLKWIESGVAIADRKPRREGFGMELLRRSLPYDLKAETKVELKPDGLRFQLKMPLSPAPDRRG